jgi:hypothetical protein
MVQVADLPSLRFPRSFPKTFPPTAAIAAAISGMGAGVEEMLPTWVLNALGKDKGAALVATPFTEGALHGKTTPPT